MTVTDVLAIIGAITGTIGTLLALAALIWDWYKWKDSDTVKLEVDAIPNFRATATGNQDYIRIMVKNVGKVTTTIKLISLHGFNNKKEMKRRNGNETGIITPSLGAALPVKLHPSDDWDGLIKQDFDGVERYLKYKHFCIQIEDSMSKFPFRAEVDQERMLNE